MSLFIPTIKRYVCPTCGGFGYESHLIDRSVKLGDVVYDEYEGTHHCFHCSEKLEIDPSFEREPRWFSLAFYHAERVYGGPEEGGWYYWTGARSNETLRVYENTPEQREMAKRYADHFEEQDRKEAKEFHQNRMHFRLEVESLPDDHFPQRRPFYH
jgi:hypothetical protein